MTTSTMTYDRETGIFYRTGHEQARCNGPTQGTPHSQFGYFRIRLNGVMHLAHRLAFFLQGIEIPEGMQVDHINGNTRDNRWANLRLVTHRENQRNGKIHRRGRLVGAQPATTIGKWKGIIYYRKSTHYLGTFDSEREAHEAYLLAAEYLV